MWCTKRINYFRQKLLGCHGCIINERKTENFQMSASFFLWHTFLSQLSSFATKNSARWHHRLNVFPSSAVLLEFSLVRIFNLSKLINYTPVSLLWKTGFYFSKEITWIQDCHLRSLTLCIWPDSEPAKLLDQPKQKPRRGGSLRHINTCRKVPLHVNFFRWRHFALVSTGCGR